jgi:hypothetical protein
MNETSKGREDFSTANGAEGLDARLRGKTQTPAGSDRNAVIGDFERGDDGPQTEDKGELVDEPRRDHVAPTIRRSPL